MTACVQKQSHLRGGCRPPCGPNQVTQLCAPAAPNMPLRSRAARALELALSTCALGRQAMPGVLVTAAEHEHDCSVPSPHQDWLPNYTKGWEKPGPFSLFLQTNVPGWTETVEGATRRVCGQLMLPPLNSCCMQSPPVGFCNVHKPGVRYIARQHVPKPCRVPQHVGWCAQLQWVHAYDLHLWARH